MDACTHDRYGVLMIVGVTWATNKFDGFEGFED